MLDDHAIDSLEEVMVSSLRHLFAHTHIFPVDPATVVCPVMPAHDCTSVLVLTSGTQDASVPSLRAVKRRLAAAVRKRGATSVVLTGRDPLCRSDLAEILAYAKHELGVDTNVATDAILFDREAMERCLPNLDRLFIPIDAENESVSALLRPSHQFSRALATIHDLAKENVRVDVSTIVTSVNLNAIVGIAPLLMESVDMWRMFQCVPGRSGNQCFVSNDDFRTIIDAIGAKLRGSHVQFEPYFANDGSFTKRFRTVEC